MFEKFKGHPVGHIIEPSLDEERFATRAMLARIRSRRRRNAPRLQKLSPPSAPGFRLPATLLVKESWQFLVT
jgi:hypothetical protein